MLAAPSRDGCAAVGADDDLDPAIQLPTAGSELLATGYSFP